MRTHKNKMLIAGVILVMSFSILAPAFAEQVTITGVVTEDFQLVDNEGLSYDVAQSAKGEEMVNEASGKTVQVIGTIEEEGGMKTIVVESYKILK